MTSLLFGASLPRPAQYLLRVDDLCPTVHAGPWERVCGLIREFGIHPILAVVPDNRDPELALSAPHAGFWPQMRELEASGATIALHGYQHLCSREGRSLIPLHRTSEFAGAPFDQQCASIEAGLAILRSHGLAPRLWIAPRHGFDSNTLLALRRCGIETLCDGLSRVPVHRDGLLWIPQQLWSPLEKTKGVWTICLHPNTTEDGKFAQLRSFLHHHAAQFTSFEQVLADFARSAPSPWERLREALLTRRLQLRLKASLRARRR